MLSKMRVKINTLRQKLFNISRAYFIIPFVLLLCAVLIRAATGGTHYIYNALDGRSLFPGPLLYTVSYFIRLYVCGLILTYTIKSIAIYRERAGISIPIIIAVTIMLLEYKLIFGGVSLILSIAGAFAVPLLVYMSIIRNSIKNRAIMCFAAVLGIIYVIFIIQLISLSFCI